MERDRQAKDDCGAVRPRRGKEVVGVAVFANWDLSAGKMAASGSPLTVVVIFFKRQAHLRDSHNLQREAVNAPCPQIEKQLIKRGSARMKVNLLAYYYHIILLS